ncbi:right-handed parallel beta-helix repeat-containing protein [Fibrobacterota bacterium]
MVVDSGFTRYRLNGMCSHDDPKIIWVSSFYEGKGSGTYEAPYTDISMAVRRAQPGNTVVLKPGNYSNRVSVQNSGTIDHPIRIVAENKGKAEVCCRAGWFFYDASDIIVSGITFRNIPHQALSAVGLCKRNSFNNLRFVNCGIDKDAPCTLFFGGSGAECNVVEKCDFEVDQGSYKEGSDIPIGLMISEGDTEEGAEPNRNHVFRKNNFINYGCAIVVGTRDEQYGAYSHIVENNHIRNCSSDGIRIKCGDTIIRGNVIQRCTNNGISIINGRTDVIADNRIEICETGVYIGGHDCSLVNNCIVRSGKQGVLVATRSDETIPQQGNTIIEMNTFVDSGTECCSRSCSNILLDTNSPCIIRRNIFHGKGKPFSVRGKKEDLVRRGILYLDDNKISGGCSPAESCGRLEISFSDKNADNYANQSGYGASGWMSEGLKIPHKKENTGVVSYKIGDYPKKILLKKNKNVKDSYFRSLYMSTERSDEEEEADPAFRSRGEDGIIDFSDWDV